MELGQFKINAIRLVGGVAVLDYLNTCNGRRPGTSLTEVVDKLGSLSDIVHWFLHAGLIDAAQHARDLQLVSREAGDHGSAFLALKRFREDLYGLLLSIAEGHVADQARLDALSETLARTHARRLLRGQGRAAFWAWRPNDTLAQLADAYIDRLGLQVTHLLASTDLERLKVCATCDCDWLFLDTSRNGRRRWCQMNICGSREKAKRVDWRASGVVLRGAVISGHSYQE